MGLNEPPFAALKLAPKMFWNTGRAGTASATAVQSHGDPGRTVQPRSSRASSAGGTRLRRRLSKTFQRSTSGRGFRLGPSAEGTVRPGPRQTLDGVRNRTVTGVDDAVEVGEDQVDAVERRRTRAREQPHQARSPGPSS